MRACVRVRVLLAVQVPKEFTEGTGSGPVLSVIAAVVMGALFVLELKDFMKVEQVQSVSSLARSRARSLARARARALSLSLAMHSL